MPKLGFIGRILGDSNERELSRIQKIVDQVNQLAPSMEALDDEALSAKTVEFRARLEDGEDLEDLLVEAFAVSREMSFRKVNERPYDVQLIGGMVLHSGRIAEMRTGEGKTLTAVAPVYLNALDGRGVHLITVNDYLARRDATWYGPVYNALGLSIGIIQNNFTSYMYDPEWNPEEHENQGLEFLRPCDRREAYRADITYGTNNEFGFDYLRDNMVREYELKSQRELAFAIVDEVDNILIDEARTPLIISGQAEEASSTYMQFARACKQLVEDQDYVVDVIAKLVALTVEGMMKMERFLGVKAIFGDVSRLGRHLVAALDAHVLKRIDRDYVVKDGDIVIVDEFTGRLMPGRRWSHGIHQAIEAKEGIAVQRESVTYATITFQNLFRLYEKLGGMTGTAETEAEEFAKIYGLDVVVIPTHRPMVREDHKDTVYINERSKFNAVVEEIQSMHESGRPVLVGTTSIEKSEYLSNLLTKGGIAHEVLNAKQHEREANIIQFAGHEGAVTIATNMAGRGTDIKLGPGVQDKGGLHVIGTERHESRRIDNQLRGRAGRQGDRGSSRFFVSFGDDIMKRFAPEWVPGMMSKLGMTEDMPLESGMVTKAIAQAQQKTEGHNFDIRKRLVDFDDVINEHRAIIYEEREKVLKGADTRANVLAMLLEEIESYAKGADVTNLDTLEILHAEMRELFLPDDMMTLEEMQDCGSELCDELLDRAEDRYEMIETTIGADNMRQVEKWLLLESIDTHWREHLTAIEDTRQSIGLQAYAQMDPLVAFKKEGFDMFRQLQQNIRRQVARTVFKVRMVEQPAPPPITVTSSSSSSSSSSSEDSGSFEPKPVGAPVAAAATQPAPGKPATSGKPAASARPVVPSSSEVDVRRLATNRGDEGDAPKRKGTKTAARRKLMR